MLLFGVQADTIHLTNGKKLEGIILEEHDDHYLALINITESIREEQTIQKSQVKSITVKPEEVKAFEKLADIVPTPNMLDTQGYESRIAAVESFLSSYPDSDQSVAAAKMLDTLEKEYALIRRGGMKFQDRLISPKEVSTNRYGIDAAIMAHEFAQRANHGNPIMALRTWNKLESEYRASDAYETHIPMALKIMHSLKSAIETELESLDKRLEEREANLANAPRRDRNRIQRAYAAREEKYQQLLAQEKEKRIVWLSLDTFEPGPMKQVHGRLEKEINRLEKLDPSSLPDGDQAWSKAWKALKNDPKSDEAKEALREFRSMRPPVEYIKLLESLLENN